MGGGTVVTDVAVGISKGGIPAAARAAACMSSRKNQATSQPANNRMRKNHTVFKRYLGAHRTYYAPSLFLLLTWDHLALSTMKGIAATGQDIAVKDVFDDEAVVVDKDEEKVADNYAAELVVDVAVAVGVVVDVVDVVAVVAAAGQD
jgi:hypothetical protein